MSLHLGSGVRLKDDASLLYVFTNVPDALEEAAFLLDTFLVANLSLHFADGERAPRTSSYAIAHRHTVVHC